MWGTSQCRAKGARFEQDASRPPPLQSSQAPQSGQNHAQMCPNLKASGFRVGQGAEPQMTPLDTFKGMQREGGSDTHGVSFSSELPLKSRLEFAGRATVGVGAPFVKVLCCLRLENEKSLVG